MIKFCVSLTESQLSSVESQNTKSQMVSYTDDDSGYSDYPSEIANGDDDSGYSDYPSEVSNYDDTSMLKIFKYSKKNDKINLSILVIGSYLFAEGFW